jgi:caffeoyl-CoA O-methyltransferase
MADDASRSGTSYLTTEVTAYLQQLHVPHDAGLSAAFDAPARHGMPAVQVGPAEGKLLGLLLRMIGATKVVEIGTLAGYSAIHMGRALGANGKLHCLELSEHHAEVARANLAAAGLAAVATVTVGPAAETLAKLEAEGPFDAVFIDADKVGYDVYGRWAARHTRPGGLLLGDNAFLWGKLLDPVDPAAAAMRRFHEEARQHYDTVCIPTPDGLLLGIHR